VPGVAQSTAARDSASLATRERVELAGGTLDITSEPGEGTTVRATPPAGRQPRAEADDDRSFPAPCAPTPTQALIARTGSARS
jgi:hypothetical protein